MPVTAPSSGLRSPGPRPPVPRSRSSRHRSARATAVRLLLIAAALLGSLLAGATPASAHAALTGSDPKQGEVTGSAPEQVALTFSEGVAMSDDSIRVLDPQGKRIDKGNPRDLGGGGTVKYGVGLRAGLPDGTYTVTWKAVSADSHPVAGAFTFSIGAPSKTAVETPQQEAGGGLVGALYDIGRYVSYAGFVLLVGGSAFVLVCWPRGASVRPVQRLVAHGWVALTAGTIALLLLRGPYTDGGKLTDAFDLSGLQAVLETKPGAALVSRLLLLTAAALFVTVLFGTYARRDAEAGGEPEEKGAAGSGTAVDGHASAARSDLSFGLAIGGAVVAAGLAATWALAEHASTGIQTTVAMPVDVLHLLAVATWLGGLVALLVALHRGPVVEREAVRRFSRVAFGSVVVLATTGLYQSWRQVGSWDGLFSTPYGRLLLIKLGLVTVLVTTARFSRRWTERLSARTEAEGAGARDEAAVAERETADAKVAGAASGSDSPAASTADAAPAGPGPRREAQLARQRAALEAARRKRIRDADPERSGLRRSVLAEAAVAVVLLAVTTLLTSTEPARTEEASRTTAAGGAAGVAPVRPVAVEIPFDTGGENGKGSAVIDLDPGRTGGNLVHVRLQLPGGTPLDAPEVKLSFSLKAEKLGPLPAQLTKVTTGHWAVRDVQLPMAGDWTVSVTVRTSDIDQVTEEKNVKIRS